MCSRLVIIVLMIGITFFRNLTRNKESFQKENWFAKRILTTKVSRKLKFCELYFVLTCTLRYPIFIHYCSFFWDTVNLLILFSFAIGRLSLTRTHPNGCTVGKNTKSSYKTRNSKAFSVFFLCVYLFETAIFMPLLDFYTISLYR